MSVGCTTASRFSEAAKSIKAWALSDSDVDLCKCCLVRFLEMDGAVPTEKECEALVCGDKNGDTAKMGKKFPHTHHYINAAFS